ncbi:MAG: VOC family protein, partial [Gemmatimonadetes bacterium]|nr:VOC family protein [Gemmatimonadota bacterium]
MPDASYRGQFLWHELVTSDTRAAAAFYARVLGWGTEEWPQDPSYTLFTNKKTPAAGLMAIPADAKAMGAQPSWMLYIGTPDVQVTAWDAQRLGGKLLKEPTRTPSVGTWAVLQDPQGAVFAAYTPENPAPVSWPPKVGEFSWHELATTDAVAAFNFYHELFGWVRNGSFDMGPSGIYQMYGLKGKRLGGMHNKSSDMPGPSNWLGYVRVPSAKRTAEVVAQAGGRIVNGPKEVPGGDWIAVATDPQGAVF